VHDPFLLGPLGQPRLDFGDAPVGLCLQHGQVSLFGDKIAEVLAEQATEPVTLQRHLTELEAERARLEKIIETVRQTVADLDLAQIADPAVFFTGLRQDQDAMRTRLRKTYGEKAEATSLDAVAEHYASLATVAGGVRRYGSHVSDGSHAAHDRRASRRRTTGLARRSDPGLRAKPS
jgi:hypothetical protein